MKYFIFISFFLFSFSSNFFSQTESTNINKAYTVIGWDSLRSIIERPDNYPEILRRAGVIGNISVALLIDSTGTLVKVEPAYGYKYFSKPDSFKYKALIPAVVKMLDSIKWHPSCINNKPINDKIYKSFNFLLMDEKGKGYNIIAPKTYINKVN